MKGPAALKAEAQAIWSKLVGNVDHQPTTAGVATGPDLDLSHKPQ